MLFGYKWYYAPSTGEDEKENEANREVKLWLEKGYLIKKFICKLYSPHFNERAYVKT